MKRFILGSMFVALLTVSAWAQEAQDIRLKMAADGKAQIEMSKAVGMGTWVELKTVKGAPYSAVSESETVQMLTDGNRIRNKTTTNIYRDSEGRTRREIVGTTPGVPAQIFINDPVSETSYSLNPKQRVAMKSQQFTVMVGGNTATVRAVPAGAAGGFGTAGAKVGTLDEAQRAELEEKMRRMKVEMEASGKVATTGGGGVMVRKNPGTTESLGQQTIEGVLCEGKRTTITIPANTIGNDQPINTITEEWYSPELQVLVLTKLTDPRHGETTYRLTNINRSEPARSLFEVPADYTVQEAPKAPAMKKRAPEEQK